MLNVPKEAISAPKAAFAPSFNTKTPLPVSTFVPEVAILASTVSVVPSTMLIVPPFSDTKAILATVLSPTNEAVPVPIFNVPSISSDPPKTPEALPASKSVPVPLISLFSPTVMPPETDNVLPPSI
ncbi:unknown [Acetobacter sp. CAG:977]|nr:unknown [Acetobacter sp. CAG:977]